MVRRLLCFACATIFLVSCIGVVSAVNASNPRYTIEELTNDENEIIRTVTKASATSRYAEERIDREYLSHMLLDLGVEENVIDNMSESEWIEIEKSPQIYTITKYQMTNGEGMIVTIPESEALAAASDVTTENTDYLKLVLLVIQQTDSPGSFRLTASTRWLTMPTIRWRDSIAICAQNFAISDGTQSGYYYHCESRYHSDGTVTYRDEDDTRVDLTSDDFELASYGNLFGTGCKFFLPDDDDYGGSVTNCTEFYVQMTFKGHVNYPTLTSNFNVFATYCHTLVTLNLNPSITIAGAGSSMDIGLGFGPNYDNTTALLEISYDP